MRQVSDYALDNYNPNVWGSLRPDPKDDPLIGGACTEVFNADKLFFAPDKERATERKLRVAEAKRICAGCPVQAECGKEANARGETHGVWGGVDYDELERQRVKALNRANKAAKAAAEAEKSSSG